MFDAEGLDPPVVPTLNGLVGNNDDMPDAREVIKGTVEPGGQEVEVRGEQQGLTEGIPVLPIATVGLAPVAVTKTDR